MLDLLATSLYNLIVLNNFHLIAKYILYLKPFDYVKLFLKALTPSLTNYLRWLGRASAALRAAEACAGGHGCAYRKISLYIIKGGKIEPQRDPVWRKDAGRKARWAGFLDCMENTPIFELRVIVELHRLAQHHALTPY